MSDPARRVYLDHASTSPARPEAIEAVLRSLSQDGGDPGRVHSEGRRIRQEIEDARISVADFLGARPREVVFTSGATESIAAATWGAGRRGSHVVFSAVEHSAVRDASERLDTTVVGCDQRGRVDADEIVGAIVVGRTSLVHLQLVNHEVGTIQPVAEVAAFCRERGVLLHVDAAAAAGHLEIDFAALGCDLLSLSAHKFGGPPGIGLLLVRRGVRLEPLLVGGAQERNRRAGLENTAAIMGFGAVARAIDVPGEAAVARAQTDAIAAAAEEVAGVTLFGDQNRRVAHIICLGVEGVEAEAVLIALDRAGIAVHSGSACASEVLEPSPVLAAMGAEAAQSVRISVGWSTTDSDVNRFCRAFSAAVVDLRALGTY